jgi:hypothetical protein
MPSSAMISDAHMGIGGDTHMALIVDGGEPPNPLEDLGLIHSGRMPESDSQAHDVWGRSYQDLHFRRCAFSNRQIDGEPIHCTGNQSCL